MIIAERMEMLKRIASRGRSYGRPISFQDLIEFHELHEILQELDAPIQLIIHCPKCHLQHVDVDDDTGAWATTRHHRQHLCKPSDGGCGHVWAPANRRTVGVRELPEVDG